MLRRETLFPLLALGLIVSGCSSTNDSPATTPQNSNVATVAPSVASGSPLTTPTAAPDKTSNSGKIMAVPNPIQVCDGSGVGVTTILYSAAPPVKVVEVRVGSPAGGQLAHAAAGDGRSSTGKWVSDGAVFYLQDVTGERPLTPDNTLATVTVKVTSKGCP